MKYSIGTNLADFGFPFLEKIHEPIFLLHRLGKITKVNEAGRKLLRIGRLNMEELETFARANILGLFQGRHDVYKRMTVGGRGLHLIVRSLRDSDFILVEVRR